MLREIEFNEKRRLSKGGISGLEAGCIMWKAINHKLSSREALQK